MFPQLAELSPCDTEESCDTLVGRCKGAPLACHVQKQRTKWNQAATAWLDKMIKST